jgi:hypothetical protein
MQTVSQSVSFGPLSGSGPQTQSTTVTMPSAVTQAVAILNGYTVEYSGGNDHHLGQLTVQVSVSALNGANVIVDVQLGLRDWSGNWDDQYDGEVFFTVVGE